MLVTAAFAGLLIYGPYESPSKGAAPPPIPPPANVPPNPADGALAYEQIVALPTLLAPDVLQERPVAAQARVVQVKRSRRRRLRHGAKPLPEAISGSDESPPVEPCCHVAHRLISHGSPPSPKAGQYRFRILTEIGR